MRTKDSRDGIHGSPLHSMLYHKAINNCVELLAPYKDIIIAALHYSGDENVSIETSVSSRVLAAN